MGFISVLFIPNACQAGNQQEESLSASVRAGLHRAVSDFAPLFRYGAWQFESCFGSL